MILKGNVIEVIYRNAENGYSVVNVYTAKGLFTCVGSFPLVTEGEDLVMNGDWTFNNKFGRQFSVKSAQVELPNTEETMVRYLSSGLIRGIGEVLAQRIVSKFKEKTFEVIEIAPHVLATVKGISLDKAISMSEDFKEHKDMQDVIVYLQAYDLSVNIAIKLYKVYGTAVQKVLEENPYQLTNDVEGIGFLTADKIAQKIGMPLDGKFRVNAGITYVLTDAANRNGHTFLYYKDLINEVSNLLELQLDIYKDLIVECIKLCETNNEIIMLEDEYDTIVMSRSFYNTEKAIAKKIVTLLNGAHSEYLLDLDLDIRTYQMMNKIELHENQINAIKNCIAYGVNIITGGPGTGKTTIIKVIISILNSLGKTFALCAPTGRAAKRLSESTSEDAKTIHRLLGINFANGVSRFTYDDNNRLTYDVVIVDEVSMCDIFIFNALIRALKRGAKLIMLGDKDQLPSVGAGNVLSDVINSKVVPINYLTHIFRQSEDSRIVYNAHMINKGEMPKLDNKARDFFFQDETNPSEILKQVIELSTTRIPKFFKVDMQDIQILCPMKKGIAGVENINAIMQQTINPKGPDKDEIVIGATIFRVGDKIIHTVNNYELEWTTDYDNTSGVGVFNGDMGYIVSINSKKPCMTVRFEDGKIATYCQGQFDQISLAYAISIHKSQGSEFKVAIIAIAGTNSMIMTRNLIYTGLTRAKDVAVIVGSKSTLGQMIANNNIAKRNSKLLDFLKQEAENNLE